jgi:hypothetical protein
MENGDVPKNRKLVGVGVMTSYWFHRSPIYSGGNVAAAWAVAALLFALIVFS